jgi:two-component system sensor histidine kinase TtrS
MRGRSGVTWVLILSLMVGGGLFTSQLFGVSSQSYRSVRIGILNHRGKEATLGNWGALASYLTQQIPEHRFEIAPLSFDEIESVVQFGEVDFVLVDPGLYVGLEQRYRVSRIATLNNRSGNLDYNLFGGVIFARADRRDIRTLKDLAGKRFAAVYETSFGGFQIAWREMKARGVDPWQDMGRLEFAGTQDQVVFDVLEGRADAGTVRTNILEMLAVAGRITMDDVKVINPKVHNEFFLAHSTQLYPEWPFSKVYHTPNALAQQVAVALLNLPHEHPAAQAAGHSGWTIPLDYQPVHELLRELNLPPYRAMNQFTLTDAIQRYWYWLLAALLVLVASTLVAVVVIRLNRELARSKQRLEERHELILNSVAEGIYGVDLDGRSTFVNHAMEQMTGWKAEELIGRNSHEMFHHTRADGSPHPSHECPVYHTSRLNLPTFVQEDIFWRRNGSSFPVEYSSTPIRGESGGTLGAVVVFRDISERLRAQEDARQHQADLAHMARLSTMGEMASGIAHELNQPLAAIVTNSQACVRMLDAGLKDSGRLADVLERIAGQAERAANIIRQLRRFVRKEEPERTQLNINELIDGVVVLFGPEARRAGVELRLKLAEGLPPVLAQHIQIEQVILNLCRNGIEAMADLAPGLPRLLTLTTAMERDGAVSVSVGDTGTGLSPEVRDRLFDPFVTTKSKGMGLGLSISLGIIEAHRGQLFADNGARGGAVFRFSLPVKQWDE